MRPSRARTFAALSVFGLALVGCADDKPTTPASSGEACSACRTLLADGGLKPAAVVTDATFAYVLKSPTSELLEVELSSAKARVVSAEVPNATAFVLRGSLLYVTSYDGVDHSLWQVDANSGKTLKLGALPGLFGIALGPESTLLEARQDSGKLRIASLDDGGAESQVLWESTGNGAYFSDFAASSSGVAWVMASSTSSTLFALDSLDAQPRSVSTRPALTIADTLTIAQGVVGLLELEPGGDRALFTFEGNELVKRGALPAAALGMRPLGAGFLVSGSDRYTLWALSANGDVRATQTLELPLNVAATADETRVLLPLEDSLATFPRSGNWL